ncbi:ABC transporter substrate-binding protein [Paenibacillus sp. P25]|nr:ABC transporter substrate-binding protein [Paenibacillus sp. P25]
MLRFQTARRSLLSLFLVFTIGLASGRGTTSGGQKPSGDAAPEAKTAGASGSASVDLGKVTLRVGQTGWGSYELGLKAAGLDKTPYKVQYHVFQGGNLQLEAMAANNLDFGSASEIPPIFASLAANGGNFKVIAANVASTLNQELVVPKGSPIQSVAELKGKKVAYVTNTTAHYFLVKMLQQAGLSWNDIEALPLSTSDGLSALISGKVDALASYGNAIISAHQNGARELASAKDILSGNFLYVATPEAINDPARHAAIVDYLSRLNQFYAWSRDNKEKWAEITASNTKRPVEQALDTLKKSEERAPDPDH